MNYLNNKASLAPLLFFELRDLLLGKALWVGIAITIFLSGYSFVQAIELYSQASVSALKLPELARGLSPLDGVFVPTFGALYLAVTFLYPFIIIRMVSSHKHSGAMKMTVQMPYTVTTGLFVKMTAALFAWVMMLLPSLSALLFWWVVGGHINTFEIVNLIIGHLLYAMVIAGITFFAASISQNITSAAIVTLGITIGFWVLDFAASGAGGMLKTLSEFSLTTILRTFERGIFSLATIINSLLVVFLLLILSGIWLNFWYGARQRYRRSAFVVLFLFIASMAIGQINFSIDTTEDRRNSFSKSDEILLKALKEELFIEVNLDPKDPRFYDLSRSILDKLKRTVPNIKIAPSNATMDIAIAANGDKYGQIIYKYGANEAMSRSTSTEEVLPLIFTLAKLEQIEKKESDFYPGYPIIVNTKMIQLWFYAILPSLFSIFWLWVYRGFNIRRKQNEF